MVPLLVYDFSLRRCGWCICWHHMIHDDSIQTSQKASASHRKSMEDFFAEKFVRDRSTVDTRNTVSQSERNLRTEKVGRDTRNIGMERRAATNNEFGHGHRAYCHFRIRTDRQAAAAIQNKNRGQRNWWQNEASIAPQAISRLRSRARSTVRVFWLLRFGCAVSGGEIRTASTAPTLDRDISKIK